jgi:hypothetical protein
MPLYSDMTEEQLSREMKELQEQGRRAFERERWSEYEVVMHKWYLARSYQLQDTMQLEMGKTYDLIESPDQLTLTKRKGVMAWGLRVSDGEEIAVPLAMLKTRWTE